MEAPVLENEVLNLLYDVIDPELGINVVDLGLIYEIEYKDDCIRIQFTLSSKGCPMGDVIMNDIKNRLETKFEGMKIVLDLVWDPEWSTERVSKEGRKQLGLI
jgi:metal-sulfur cluster biosynthetic enzyme